VPDACASRRKSCHDHNRWDGMLHDPRCGGGNLRDIDQDHIQCFVCGKSFPFNRWSSGPRRCTCSSECQAALDEVTSNHTSERWLLKRAARPGICVYCGGPLEGVRCNKIYCTPKCEKAAWRKGVNADRMMRVRKEAILGKDAPKERSGTWKEEVP